MALGPKQMGEAVLRNLKSKTGKDINQWIAILKKENLSEKKETMTFLKTEHGLGHFQAQSVFMQMTISNIYDKSEDFVTVLFSTPELLKRYQSIEKTIKKLSKDIQVQPCKTYIPFYRKKQFAIVKPYQKNKLLLALNLPDDFTHLRFEKGKSGASDRINFKTILAIPKDFDQEIKDVIKIALGNN